MIHDGTHSSTLEKEPITGRSYSRGNVSKTLRRLTLAVLVWHVGSPGFSLQTVEPASEEDRQPHHIVTGTLDQLDFKTGKGLLKTDLGKPVFFEMVRPEMFSRLSVGQQVTIGMNEQGQAVKVIETPPVELLSPPPSAP